MAGGKHASDEEFEFEFNFRFFRNILTIVIILALIAGVIFISYSLVSKMKETKTADTSAEETVIEEEPKYAVLGKIVIDKMDIQQDIYDTDDEQALEEGVIKLYGDRLNSIGNFCIAGHNYKNIFGKLEELELGDEIKILDKNDNETIYKISNIFSVEPTDLTELKAEEGKTQITLITCANYSTKRLIVKADKQ